MAWSLSPHFPHPSSIAPRTSDFKERDFFPVCQSYWESASHAYLHGNVFGSSESLPHFFSQIIGVNTHCAYELVGRCFHWSEWLVWAFQSGKGAESCESGDRRKENRFPAWRTSRKPQPASKRCGDHLPPHPEVFPQSLSQGLLSTKHNTNVCFVRPQFKGPYLFQ